MISFCIKNNNINIINYLLKNISLINLDNIYFCRKKFSKYNNIILHYTGDNSVLFYNELTNIISNCIIKFYEPLIVNNIININYFYFDLIDIQCIEDIALNQLSSGSKLENLKYISNFKLKDICIDDRKKCLWTAILKYITSNKSILLDGFIRFRLFEYLTYIDSVIDSAVNQFILDKEYSDFINLLKLYINAKSPQSNTVHLVYINGESILLDNNKNIISITKNILDIHYLSDISFSSNDYALNSLLTLLPNKIIIHLITLEDEFINTIKLIFGESVKLCTDCNICHTYKMLVDIKSEG